MKLQSLNLLNVSIVVKEAWIIISIAQSYAESDQYLIMQRGDVTTDPETVYFAVFKKTPFVIQRFGRLRKVEETENTAKLGAVRRSSFYGFSFI